MICNKAQFAAVLALIENARARALACVNVEMIALYWRIGEYIHDCIEADGWGQSTVADLADYVQSRDPGLRGYS